MNMSKRNMNHCDSAVDSSSSHVSLLLKCVLLKIMRRKSITQVSPLMLVNILMRFGFLLVKLMYFCRLVERHAKTKKIAPNSENGNLRVGCYRHRRVEWLDIPDSHFLMRNRVMAGSNPSHVTRKIHTRIAPESELLKDTIRP